MNGRAALAGVGIGFLLVFVVATGAAVASDDDDVIDAEPIEEENGSHATVAESNTVLINTTADDERLADVFALTNEAPGPADVQLEYDDQHVTVSHDGAPITQADPIELDSGETIAVDVAVHADDPEAVDPVTVEIDAAPAGNVTTPPTPTVDVDSTGEDVRNVGIRDASAGTTASADLEEQSIGPSTTLERTDVTLADGGTASFQVDGSWTGAAGERLEQFSGQTGATALGGFYVVNPPAADAIEDVEYVFAVDRTHLEDRGIDPEEVQLHRYDADADEWTPIETTVRTSETETVRFAAEFDRFSAYAVGAESTAVEVTDAQVEREEAAVDESMTTSATVTNDGPTNATVEVDLRVDGEVVESQTVTVPADGAVQTEFEYAFDDDGEYDVGVDDATAGTVTVGDEPTEEPGGFGVAETGLVLSLLAVTPGILWLARRRLDVAGQ